MRPVPFLGPPQPWPRPNRQHSDFCGSARLTWAPGHREVPATLHPSAPQPLQAAAFSEWRPVIGGRALRNVALSPFCAQWPYSRASGWCGRGESPVAALERTAGGRSGWQQVPVTCRDPGRETGRANENSCSPHSGEVQLRDFSMRSLYETATKASAGPEAVLPGNRESLDCYSVRDGAFHARTRASKRGRVLVIWLL